MNELKRLDVTHQTTRFNRYMVECEYRKKVIIFRIVGVLIDTWWNVNQVKGELICHMKNVLIDTWWNVNECLQFLKCTQSVPF